MKFESIVYIAAIIVASIALCGYIAVTDCNKADGLWLDGECHYGLNSGGSVEKVRK